MVALNTEAIRKAAFRQIQKQRKALEKETQSLDRFLHTEQPAFLRWLAGVAGELLTEIREAEAELDRLENLVANVQENAWINGITRRQAYRQVRATESRRAAKGGPDLNESAYDESSSPDDRASAMEDEFDRFVHENIPPHLRGRFEDEVKRFSKEAFGEDLSWLMKGIAPSEGTAALEVQLKTLYRQMVAILHPDRRDPKLNQDLCTELWHDLQRAYQDRDLERLRTVYARAEYSLGIDTPQQTTVWELRAEAERLRVALRAVKNQITQVRLSPGWQFSTRNDLDTYASQLKRQLRQEAQIYKEEVAALLTLLRSWDAGDAARRKPRRRKKETWPQSCELL